MVYAMTASPPARDCTPERLQALKKKSCLLLRLGAEWAEIKRAFIRIARYETPTQTERQVKFLAIQHGFGINRAEKISLAAWALAAIKRDCGEDVFNKVVDQSTKA